MSDVLSEIESIQRSKVTNDFLDEIIDSDTGTDESSTMINTSNDVNLYTSGQKEMKKFLEEIGEKNAKYDKYFVTSLIWLNVSRQLTTAYNYTYNIYDNNNYVYCRIQITCLYKLPNFFGFYSPWCSGR